MKMVVLTSASSSKSSASASASAIRDRSEGRGDSCYFPGCRKDTNCNCDICIASINATLDLIPSGSTIQQSSLTKLSESRSVLNTAPAPSDRWTPPASPETGSTFSVLPRTPTLRSTAKSRRAEKVIRKERSWVLGYWILRFLGALCLVLAVDLGVPVVVLRGFGPKLTPEMVRRAGEESRVFGGDLKGRLEFLQEKVEGLVVAMVSNCSSLDSIWELNQGDHLFLHWRCVIYQSVAEEVSIWGSPLRTSGLLPTGFSSKSLTILSGRITEWSEGKLSFSVMTSNTSSWTCRRWSTAAVQLDPNTWVLEYRRRALLQGPRLLPLAWEALSARVSRLLQELKQEAWPLLLLLPTSSTQPSHTLLENFKHPT